MSLTHKQIKKHTERLRQWLVAHPDASVDATARWANSAGVPLPRPLIVNLRRTILTVNIAREARAERERLATPALVKHSNGMTVDMNLIKRAHALDTEINAEIDAEDAKAEAEWVALMEAREQTELGEARARARKKDEEDEAREAITAKIAAAEAASAEVAVVVAKIEAAAAVQSRLPDYEKIMPVIPPVPVLLPTESKITTAISPPEPKLGSQRTVAGVHRRRERLNELLDADPGADPVMLMARIREEFGMGMTWVYVYDTCRVAREIAHLPQLAERAEHERAYGPRQTLPTFPAPGTPEPEEGEEEEEEEPSTDDELGFLAQRVIEVARAHGLTSLILSLQGDEIKVDYEVRRSGTFTRSTKR